MKTTGNVNSKKETKSSALIYEGQSGFLKQNGRTTQNLVLIQLSLKKDSENCELPRPLIVSNLTVLKI